MNKEPSIWDYVKARLMPWKGPVPDILGAESESGNKKITPDSQVPQPDTESETDPEVSLPSQQSRPAATFPWRSISAILMALLAQLILEPGPNPDRWVTSLIFYIPAFVLLIWAFKHKEWYPAHIPEQETYPDPFTFRIAALLAGIVLLVLAYLAFGGNRFNALNLILWAAGSALAIYSLWMQPGMRGISEKLNHLGLWIRQPKYQFSVSAFSLLWLLVFAIAVFFRVYQLSSVPPEMNSDHAEKLLDVVDILSGQTSIFFPRNTGREPLQFYMIAATVQMFGTGISFISMKIGTALAGLLTLPFIYLIGKEIANRRVGLLAMAFAAIASWPNILSRIALRFSLYPLFVAPTLYFLLRGLRSGKRNDFILSGLFLGIGLLGYTPIRILPLAVAVIVAVYILHTARTTQRQQAVLGLLLIAFFAIIGSLPLLRYAQDDPSMFAYRAFSRLTNLDIPLPHPAWLIILDNLKNALLMFGWNDGQIWPVSIPGRPALDFVSAALFHFGLILLLVRYLTQRKWEDLSLLLTVPILMLPSILSLAFPAENPAPNRAGGVMVPVFIIIGLSLEGLLNGLKKIRDSRSASQLAAAACILLFSLAAAQNYGLVFTQYQQQYTLAAWNSSEMGMVLKNFAASGGSLEAAWVVKSPHWVDTRLVGMYAGEPQRDFGIDRENMISTLTDPRPKIFLIRHQTRPEDRVEEEQNLNELQTLYPSGWAQLYPSRYSGKEFWIFYAPPVNSGLQNSTFSALPSP